MNKYFFRVVLLFFAAGNFLLPNQAKAQIEEPVKWSFVVQHQKDNKDNVVLLTITAKVDKDWHLYSQYNTLGITQATVFTYDKSENYKLVGKTIEPKYVEFTDEYGTDRYFEKSPVVFTQKIKVLSEKDFVLTGMVEAQACINDKCIYVSTDFDIPIKGMKQIVSDEQPEEEDADSSNIEDATENTGEIIDSLKNTMITEGDSSSETEDGMSTWVILLISFFAGLAALLTPCVFPMVPLTVNFFMKGDSKKNGFKNALIFGFSIIIIFAILGMLLSLIFGGDAAYMISTHWIPNMLFFIIFMVFALSFFGLFEITLPSSWSNKSDAKSEKGGLVGIFFVALTTVIVSFSCIGPILGGVVFSFSTGESGVLTPLVSMLGFAFGFAIPFTLLALCPSVMGKMKSGSWMNSVKIVFAFLEMALGLKFLSQADLYCGWGILDREVYLAFWIVIFALMGFYLLGKLKFKGDSDVKQLGVPRIFLSIVTFAFVIYLIPGMWGAPLKALSGFVPPLTTQDFDTERLIVENKITSTTSTSSIPEGFENVKHGDQLHFPTGFYGFFDLEDAKAYAKKVNKPIFVDFTGKTCANCREMEFKVWTDPHVRRILTEEYVMVALYADANTIILSEEEWVTNSKGKVLKRLGDKNRNYQMEKYKVNAQPYYVLLDANENILSKNGKGVGRSSIQEFTAFLEEGLEEFNKRK